MTRLDGGRSSSGPLWGLGGVVVGLGLGYGGERALHHFNRAPAKPIAKKVTIKPQPTGATLSILPQPAQKGLLISAPSGIKLVTPGASGRTQQQGASVFTGFKNWTGTANYLASGQGDLQIKGAGGTAITTNWAAADYKYFVKGTALTTRIAGGPFTLFFQRKGRSAVNLGTFSLGSNGAGTSLAAPANLNANIATGAANQTRRAPVNIGNSNNSGNNAAPDATDAGDANAASNDAAPGAAR